MSITNDCLDYMIGLSRTDCECANLPEGFDISNSGLYISDLYDYGMFRGLATCDYGDDFWIAVSDSLEEAKLKIRKDIIEGLLKRNSVRPAWNGAIGRVNGKLPVLSVDGQYAGVRWFCADVVGGKAIITKIGTYFSATGTVDLIIYNNKNEYIEGYTLNTIADKHVENVLPEALELPLHDDMLDNVEYFFFVLTDAGNRPRNNDVDCKCGSSKPYFNCTSPPFETATDRNRGWMKWVMVGGYHGDGTELDDQSCTTNLVMYGLTFPEVRFYCELSDIFCEHTWDYENSTVDLTVAFALRYAACEILADKIFLSSEFSRENLVNGEILAQYKLEWHDEYLKCMAYLEQNYPADETDCIVCKEPMGLKKIRY
jgi:hypothetical protein